MQPRDSYKTFCDDLAPSEIVYLGGRKYLFPDEKKLEDNMAAFYQETKPNPGCKTMQLEDLLNDNFIVGECHSHVSPKKFLIEKMSELKAAGFTTLFMEHLIYDEQSLLNEFHKSGIMNEHLKNRLYELDAGFGKFHLLSQLKDQAACWKKNNFLSIVTAAQAAGIRVVALDTYTTYTVQKDRKHMEYYGGDSTGKTRDNFRIKSMNFTACKIISKETANDKGKWFALMGNAHVKRFKGIPGVAELTGARSVYIFDAASTLNIKINATHQFNEYKLAGDVVITMQPDQSVPVIKKSNTLLSDSINKLLAAPKATSPEVTDEQEKKAVCQPTNL